MNTNDRIKKLMFERNWTEYRLAKEANLSQSTIANLFNRNTLPGITTLEAICSGFGITMAQFFCDGNFTELTPDQKNMFDKWISLTEEQKGLIYKLIDQMK